MVFCSLIASSAIRAFISALKLRRCLDFISAPFPRQRFYTLLTGPNFGEHLIQRCLALTDTSFMPRPWEMKEKFDLITADFTYVRWLGNRKEIEEQTTTWDKTIIDRTGDLKIAGEQHQSLAVGK